ncbi:hypothetical protein ACLB2K_032102 [Fragaria x ananassa]
MLEACSRYLIRISWYQSSGESFVDSMSKVGRRGGGFRIEGCDVNNDIIEIKRMLQQLAVGRRGGGFRIEGRDLNNDITEIKRMFQQLSVSIDRIEARLRGRKSSNGERDVTATYH